MVAPWVAYQGVALVMVPQVCEELEKLLLAALLLAALLPAALLLAALLLLTVVLLPAQLGVLLGEPDQVRQDVEQREP